MHPVIRDIYSNALLIYDRLLFVRELLVNNMLAQFLGALFFVGSLFVAIVLFVYWGFCAWRLMAANDLELTEAEIELMRWDKHLCAQLWHLVHRSGGRMRLS